MRQTPGMDGEAATENLSNLNEREDSTKNTSSPRDGSESQDFDPTLEDDQVDKVAPIELGSSNAENGTVHGPSKSSPSPEQVPLGPSSTTDYGSSNDNNVPRVTLGHESDGTQTDSQPNKFRDDGTPDLSPIQESSNANSPSATDKSDPSCSESSPTRKCEDPDGVEPSKKQSRLFTDSFLNILADTKSEDESELPPVPENSTSLGDSTSPSLHLRRESEKLIAALAMEPEQHTLQEEKKSIDPASPAEHRRMALSMLSEATESTTSTSVDSAMMPAPAANAGNAAAHSHNPDVHIETNDTMLASSVAPPAMYPMESDLSVASVHSISARLATDELARSGHLLAGNVPLQQHPLIVVPHGHPVAGSVAASPYPGYAMQTIAPAFQPMHPPTSVIMSNGGKRRIHLRLVEETVQADRRSLFSSFRRNGRKSFSFPYKHDENEVTNTHMEPKGIHRGQITVSWYEGTTSLELQEHVRNSVVRKLGLNDNIKLDDFRILDEAVDPPEEIVLCPFIPDGSNFLLRFSTKTGDGDATPFESFDGRYQQRMLTSGPPDSPSAAPSPLPSSTDLNGLGLNANQLALLGARLKGLQIPSVNDTEPTPKLKKRLERNSLLSAQTAVTPTRVQNDTPQNEDSAEEAESNDHQTRDDTRKVDDDEKSKTSEMPSLHPEDPIEARLRQITDLLLAERSRHHTPRQKQEKRQVIFVLANYFVLFLSLIAISAEIQARAPGWHASVEGHLKNVQTCATDRDALFDCVSNGDFAGLVASVVLWISRSAATRRIFLFGFESTQKLWTVVYESLVTAVCWGFSYMFIRRGMNPDTSRNFLYKYWKDAVYGSLAGFNAAFMKQVLKNLIPQEAIEDALQERQLKILSWLPSFTH